MFKEINFIFILFLFRKFQNNVLDKFQNDYLLFLYIREKEREREHRWVVLFSIVSHDINFHSFTIKFETQYFPGKNPSYL